MHLEAYVPIQSGLIAYEVCKGLVNEQTNKKFTDHFAKKVIKSLEKNALKACDMNASSRLDLVWRKLQYKVPKEIKTIIENQTDDIGGEDEDTPWVNVLRNVNLNTVHLFQERSMGKKELKKKEKTISLVESIARQYSASGEEKSHITGKLNAVDKKTSRMPL